MKTSFHTAVTLFFICFASCGSGGNPVDSNGGNPIDSAQFDYEAPFVQTAPVIDGNGDDSAWTQAEWKPIDQVWLGGGNASPSNLTPPPAADYSGRFKIVWTEDRLYYLVEIKDTYLSLTRLANPYNQIYNDDCLELFINEEGKGGMHENNNIAFAYHMSYDGVSAMDYVTGQNNNSPFTNGYIARNHHVNYKIGNLDLANKKSVDGTHLYTWEIEMKIFNKNYPIAGNADYTPEKLSQNKTMGFAVAYCNAGKSNSREYFMGNVFISGANKNVAYQNADVFAKLRLVK